MNGINRSFPLDLLSEGNGQTPLCEDVTNDMKRLIVNTLAKCSIDISEISYVISPAVVRFEFIPLKGVNRKQILSCEDVLNEALSDYDPVRLIVSIPGKETIAVEVPRTDRQIIYLKEVLESKEIQESKAHLPIALGIDSENSSIVADLAKLPHLLIAGANGQGQITLLRILILSLLYKQSPTNLKLVMIGPKQGGLNQFNTINGAYILQTSYMFPRIITEIENVPIILRSIEYEVRYRYDLLRISECQTIYEYNQQYTEGKLSKAQYHHIPYIIIVIDEFADLMISQGRDFAAPLVGIAQRSKAVGIHLIIATQHPSTDIITGIIKANFPARIAFKVRSEIDSKTILDITRAEQLLGMKDMLFNNSGSITRIQGCFVDNKEIESVCDWIAKVSPKDNSFVLPIISDPDGFYKSVSEGDDPLFVEEAHRIVKTMSFAQLHSRLGEPDLSEEGIEIVPCNLDNEENSSHQINVAKTLKEKGKIVLSIGLLPFSFETKKTMLASLERAQLLQHASDGCILINKDSFIEKGSNPEEVAIQIELLISDIEQGLQDILRDGIINIEAETVREALRDCVTFMMTYGDGMGADRVGDAFRNAYESQLYCNLELTTARTIVIKILLSKEDTLTYAEQDRLTQLISDLPKSMNIIFGIGISDLEANQIRILILGTGVDSVLG